MSLPINKKKLNVLLVSTSYPQNERDWQGRFIADMVQALSEIDTLRLCVWAPSGSLPANVQSNLSPSDKAWLTKLLARGGIAHVLRTHGIKGIFFAFTLLQLLRRTYRQKTPLDVTHVNWLQNALPLWGTSTPAVITVLGSDLAFSNYPE